MRAIEKKIVTDENSRPVAVQISYRDWLEIERLLGLQSGMSTSDLSQHYDVIRLDEEPLAFQEQMRSEWP